MRYNFRDIKTDNLDDIGPRGGKLSPMKTVRQLLTPLAKEPFRVFKFARNSYPAVDTESVNDATWFKLSLDDARFIDRGDHTTQVQAMQDFCDVLNDPPEPTIVIDPYDREVIFRHTDLEIKWLGTMHKPKLVWWVSPSYTHGKPPQMHCRNAQSPIAWIGNTYLSYRNRKWMVTVAKERN